MESALLILVLFLGGSCPGQLPPSQPVLLSSPTSAGSHALSCSLPVPGERVTQVHWRERHPNGTHSDIGVQHPVFGNYTQPMYRREVTLSWDGNVTFIMEIGGGESRVCCQMVTYPSGVAQESCVTLRGDKETQHFRPDLVGALLVGGVFTLGTIVILCYIYRTRTRRVLTLDSGSVQGSERSQRGHVPRDPLHKPPPPRNFLHPNDPPRRTNLPPEAPPPRNQLHHYAPPQRNHLPPEAPSPRNLFCHDALPQRNHLPPESPPPRNLFCHDAPPLRNHLPPEAPPLRYLLRIEALPIKDHVHHQALPPRNFLHKEAPPTGDHLHHKAPPLRNLVHSEVPPMGGPQTLPLRDLLHKTLPQRNLLHKESLPLKSLQHETPPPRSQHHSEAPPSRAHSPPPAYAPRSLCFPPQEVTPKWPPRAPRKRTLDTTLSYSINPMYHSRTQSALSPWGNQEPHEEPGH